eukprot:669273-Pleurochrysis_carterae.AAC.1
MSMWPSGCSQVQCEHRLPALADELLVATHRHRSTLQDASMRKSIRGVPEAAPGERLASHRAAGCLL